MSAGDFLKIVYANVLSRTGDTAPNDEEIGFWNQKLISESESRGSIVSSILEVVHKQYDNHPVWGWVGKLLDNKAALANKIAVEWGISYATPEESITKGMEIASAVTADSMDNAINLVGLNSAFE